MKLPQLLSQFLYQFRKMDLPGIGSFTLDPAAVIPGESDRDPQHPASGISFKNANISTPDDELIRFIQTHTGKMKPLAAADLDFFLTSGKQMLNIGKPFYLEGIGTLLKKKDGRLDFTPGEYSTARLEEAGPTKPEKRASVFDKSSSGSGYEPRTNSIRQMLLLVGIIGGLIVIGWGGYSLYKRNTVPEPGTDRPQAAPIIHDTVATHTDTTARVQMPPPNAAAPKSSAVISPPPLATPPIAGESLYKFIILETAHKGRALRRYNQLLGFQLNIKMEQKDSSDFKLYFPISATYRDTTHIKDSLADVYAAHVTIER